jgi:hypothetical protein
MKFQIIASFENIDEVIFDLETKNITNEDIFMKVIFDNLEFDEIKELTKLSICQTFKNKDEIMDWLIDRNGKYYFNYELNDDSDTKKWYEYKNNYLN